MPPTRNQRRLGLTVLELLVASTLATLVMATLLGVLGGISRRQQALRRAYPMSQTTETLSDQLYWDITNSNALEISANRIRLVGFAGHHFSNGEPSFRPTEVTYHLVRDRFRSWMARTESHLDERNNKNARTQLVCPDVVQMSATLLEGEQPKKPDKSEDAVKESPAARAVRIVFVHEDHRKSVLNIPANSLPENR